MDQVLYGIDYIEYYFYWIYYKFIGYPLIIRICSIAVMFCIIAYLFLLFHIIYGIFKRRKEKRRYNKAFDKYYEEMKSISLDYNTLSEEEMKKLSSLDMGYSGSRAKHFDPEFVRTVLNNKIHD